MLATILLLAASMQDPGPVLAGRVVDARGDALAGAEVGVGCQGEGPQVSFDLLGEARTDGEGRFRLQVPGEWLRRVGYRHLVLFAHGAGHGLRAVEIEPAELPLGLELELALPADPAERVRIVDAEGLPVADAVVQVLAIDDPLGWQLRFPEAWWEGRAPRSDAQGWSELPVPLAAVQRLRVLAPGHVPHAFSVDRETRAPLPRVLTLAPQEEFRIAWEGGELPARALRLARYRLQSEGQDHQLDCEWEVPLPGGDAGALTSLGPPGVKSPRLAADDASALRWSLDPEASSAGGVGLVRAPTLTVRGRVVDARDGRPVPGARLYASSWPGQGWIVSGADGTFALEVSSKVRGGSISQVLAPPGYRSQHHPENTGFVMPPEGGDLELSPIALEPTEPIRGRVLDGSGARVPGAWIFARASVPAPFGIRWVDLTALADEEGRFVLEDAPLGHVFALAARAGGGLARAEARAGEELELTLVPLLAARGRLVDGAGQPVAGARIELWREPESARQGGAKRQALAGRDHLRSGPDGGFEGPPLLEPGARFTVRALGAGIETLSSAGLAAEELARGVELLAVRRDVLRSTLRGSDGEPLAGVLVRLRRGRSSARTDAEGRFELGDLPPEGDVLVAERPGEPPRARWAAAGEEVDWVLAARSEGPRLEPEAAHDRESELLLAFELLESEYQGALASGDEGRLLRAVQSLAFADPALVLERVDVGIFETSWRRDFSLAYVADALREQSPEEALAVSRRIARGMSASLSGLRSARLLEPAAEREQLALLRAEARAVDPPEHRLVVLAELADRLLDLDELAAAQRVLADGLELARSLPPTEWPGYARCSFAEVLSRVDRAAGRALIDELADAAERPRHLGNSAQKLAASDPEGAEALLSDVEGARSSWEAQRYAGRVAHAMAPVDLARARAIAQRHDSSGFADGMIALALAESGGDLDRSARDAEARSSLETAFARAEAVRGTPHWTYTPTAVTAALLAVAERVDPGGLEVWVARALALPRPPPGAGLHAESNAWQADAALAFHVARWDRELARALLEPALAAALAAPDVDRNPRRAVVWAALAIIDPERAASIARERGGEAAARIGLVLAIPPESRTRYVQEKLLNLWVVGKEDL